MHDYVSTLERDDPARLVADAIEKLMEPAQVTPWQMRVLIAIFSTPPGPLVPDERGLIARPCYTR